jgi:hypothetical protein
VAWFGSASSVGLIHNHPSGDATPSREDLRLTRKLVEAGKLLDICVHDHVIIGNGGAYLPSRHGGVLRVTPSAARGGNGRRQSLWDAGLSLRKVFAVPPSAQPTEASRPSVRLLRGAHGAAATAVPRQ